MGKIVKTFEIEWDELLGIHWMNTGNLVNCLNSEEHCGSGLIERVTEKDPQVEAEDEWTASHGFG